MKICLACQTEKALTEYGRRACSKDGLMPVCRPCISSRNKARRVADPERQRAIFRAWYHRDPSHARRLRDESRRRNLETDLAKSARKRARANGREGKFTAEEWKELKARHGHRCLACRKTEPAIKLQADHIVPLTKGGSNSIDNIQPLCGSCNKSKRQREIDYRVSV